MSWSVSFVAQGKATARATIEKDTGLPVLIKALAVDAIEQVRLSTPAGLIAVKGYGHQATRDSIDSTTCTLEINAIEVIRP